MEELLSKVTHKCPEMSLKLTSTLSQQTPQQDPFLRWKQSKLLYVFSSATVKTCTPEVNVYPVPKRGAFGNTTAVYPSPKYNTKPKI